tara:strand:+ start:2056 stop:3012 length:957 start_codon:yes stop_codon:yes gene_type:complete
MTERVIKFLPNMAKILLAMTIMIVSMAMFIANINQANSATPIRDVTITGENITLGDVFDGVTKNRDFVLAPAPRPDTVLTWDAATLNRVARAFDLPWRATATDQIHIRRLASLVSEDMLKKAIAAHLRDQGLTGAYDLDFVGAKPEIILPHDIEPSVEIQSASFNASRKTFSATVRTPDNKVKQFTGVANPLVTIPVLKTPLARGDVITKNMVGTTSIREDYVTDDMIVQAEDLIGMTPRRVVRANAAITLSDLDKPMMVKRGDLVTMELKNGPIAITAIAKAMENGTKGDIIRLMNVDSKRSLEAQVTGMREARIFN